ncbi:MAG: protoglobin domain-containing protein [Gammaproteobacteria bacterium]|nr:protoglobin domain-containing protein [Gammaproteobacteria bacterium]MDH3415744.1 protoglobin domain-containing protein [Gammaproteobacteria bacterium]
MIEERLRFLEIDQDVTKELRNVKQILEPEMDRMLDEFYSHILDEPQVKAVFADDKAVERARQAQKNHWLKTLFGGKFEGAYFDQAERIGRAHARVGLTPNWYIGGYCNMLVKFIRHILAEEPKEGRDVSPTIEALSKAVLLDLDLVIHCYLEAKDRVMLDLLMRATRFTDELAELNSELGIAAAQVKESTEALSKNESENDRQAGQLAALLAKTDAVADKVKQIDERISKLKFDDRLYLHRGSGQTGTFAKLKALVLGK